MAREYTREELEIFTEEQLHYLEKSRRRSVFEAAHDAVKRQRNQGLVAFLLLLGGLIYVIGDARNDQEAQNRAIVASGRVVAVDGCNRDYANNERMRGLLERLRDSAEMSYRRGRTTYEQYQIAMAFYQRELRNFGPLDCRVAERLITDDPNDIPRDIEPAHPGNPDPSNP